MSTISTDGYVDAAKDLLKCKISGASREVCERMIDGGSYENTEADKQRIEEMRDEIEGLQDEISSLERRIEEIENNPNADCDDDKQQIRSLCLMHGVPIPN